jgi:transposase
MAQLRTEQIMVGAQMVERGLRVRELAPQLGVTEGALRYRLKQRDAGPREDGRRHKKTSLDGLEVAVHQTLMGLGCWRVTGAGRPVQASMVHEVLAKDHGYKGSYRAGVRHLRRAYPAPPMRALRRVETPPGVQAQPDWFEITAVIGGRRQAVQALLGVLSHSRAKFCWGSPDATQLAWHTGHLALFERYGGVPLWVRTDNLRTGVARGAGRVLPRLSGRLRQGIEPAATGVEPTLEGGGRKSSHVVQDVSTGGRQEDRRDRRVKTLDRLAKASPVARSFGRLGSVREPGAGNVRGGRASTPRSETSVTLQ